MKNKLIEAIREAAYYVRSLSEIDGRPHDFRTDDGHIMIVDFNIRRWTDETDEEFLKQFAEYDRGFIETLKRFMERNYKDFKACGLDGNKQAGGVLFHDLEHLKRLVDILEEATEQAKQAETAQPISDEQAKASEYPPKELQTDEAKEMLSKAIKEGLISLEGERYVWKGRTKSLCAYFSMEASEYLKLDAKVDSDGDRGTSWKPFERLFNMKGFAVIKSKWEVESYPKGYKNITKFFKTCIKEKEKQ